MLVRLEFGSGRFVFLGFIYFPGGICFLPWNTHRVLLGNTNLADSGTKPDLKKNEGFVADVAFRRWYPVVVLESGAERDASVAEFRRSLTACSHLTVHIFTWRAVVRHGQQALDEVDEKNVPNGDYHETLHGLLIGSDADRYKAR